MYNERFARQYHYRLPSEFPLGLPFTGIVHHLSGPNRHVHTQTSHNRMVRCWCKIPSQYFHCADRLCHPWTHTHVRLLGPCFKTGRTKPCSHRAVRARVEQRHSRTRGQATMPLQLSSHSEPTLIDKTRSTAHSLLRAYRSIARSGRQAHLHAAISPSYTGFLHFPFSRFRHCYLSLQSPVSPFPHGTCLLLVSNIYSALDEIYHPLHAPIPRNMTLRRHTVH